MLLWFSCGEQLLSKDFSPDGKVKAVVMEGDCGATTDFTTWISIIPSDQSLPRRKEIVMGWQGRPQIRVSWRGDHTLVWKKFGEGELRYRADSVEIKGIHRKIDIVSLDEKPAVLNP